MKTLDGALEDSYLLIMLESGYGSFESVHDIVFKDFKVNTESLGVFW